MKLLHILLLMALSAQLVLSGCKKVNELPDEVTIDTLFYKNFEATHIFSADSITPFTVLSASDSSDAIILHNTSRMVKTNNDTTEYLINRMYRTIAAWQGNIDGLTAPEIGINRDIVLIKRTDKTGSPVEVMLNPRITQHSFGTTQVPENCVTRPGAYPTTLDRYNLVFVEYDKPDGTHTSEMLEEEVAYSVQHHIAHLGGGVIDLTIDPFLFTPQEIDSIMAGPDSVMMRVYLTTNYADSLVLRRSSTDIRPDSNNVALLALISRMYEAMITEGGVGIAAPQVGINRNVVWVKRMDLTGKPYRVYLNPRITSHSVYTVNFAGDGCLSVPNLNGTTLRWAAITIEYDLLDGQHYSEVIQGTSVSNFTSICFQHEIDHLNGILFFDRFLP